MAKRKSFRLQKLGSIKINDTSDQKVSYSDIATIRVSAEEMVFHFGLRQEDSLNIGEGVAKVYVSLPHAKRIANVLLSSIEGYEEVFGEIEGDPEKRLSPEIRERLEKELTRNRKDKDFNA